MEVQVTANESLYICVTLLTPMFTLTIGVIGVTVWYGVNGSVIIKIIVIFGIYSARLGSVVMLLIEHYGKCC